MATAYVEVRSQRAKGTWPQQGPDTYVSIQIVPDGVEPLRCLNKSAAKRRGIKIVYCGEGYHERRKTEKSMLRIAIAEAERMAKKINKGEKLCQSK